MYIKWLKRVMLVYVFLFIGANIIFATYPVGLIEIINLISAKLFPSLKPAKDIGFFYVALTVSMMMIVTTLSYMIYSDPIKNINLAIPLVAGKFTSATFGVIYFIVYPALAYILIFITDFPIGLIALILYTKAKKEIQQ